jgi:transketolase
MQLGVLEPGTPENVVEGVKQMKPRPTRDAYGETLRDLGLQNPRIVALDADLSGSTRTAWFKAKCPDRFFNLGIAEQNLIGVAAGLALSGKIPFVSSFAIFLTGRPWEQIRQSIAYPRLNVKLAGSHAGLTVGADGASHQALEDVSIMRSIPNMTVVCPADAVETAKATRAIAEYDGPVYMRLSRAAVPTVFDESYSFRLGRAVKLVDGGDVTICASGVMLDRALKAAEWLRQNGINATVLNVSTIKPLDVQAIIESSEKTGAVVTAEEHNIIGGLGSAVAEALVEHNPVPMVRVGVEDSFGQSGEPNELLVRYGLCPPDIASAVMRVLERRSSRFASVDTDRIRASLSSCPD